MKRKGEGDISLLGKFIFFVRDIYEKIKDLRLPEKLISYEKSLAGYDDKDSPKESKIAFYLGMARLSSIVTLCVLIVAVLIFNGSILSFDNVYYMFKDISYISSFNESRPSTLNYSRPFSNQDFAVFKNGLSVAGDSEIKFFTSTGRVTMTQGSEYTNPKICSSASSVLIYDQGKYDFKVYNSFVSIYSESLDYPISSADMADDGSFCIVTKSESYGSVVRVYDEKQRFELEYSRNDYIISVDMSSNGKYIAVMSLDASGGESVATVTVVERGRSSSKSTISIPNVLPYTASFIADDRIALICSEEAYVYDINGDEQSRQSYSGKLADFSVCYGGFALLFREGSMDSSFTLSVFGENGKSISSYKIDTHVSDMILDGNYAYLILDGEIRRIDTLFGIVSRAEFNEEGATLMAFSSGDIMACTDTVAYYISFN